MAREIHRLNARRVATEDRIGRHADGGGLYLSISANGGKRWVFLFKRDGKPREMGLGSARNVSLASARRLAARARQQRSEGIDPLAARQFGRTNATFRECAEALIEAKQAGWRNSKHASQWKNTLEFYVYPAIGALQVDEINVGHVMKIFSNQSGLTRLKPLAGFAHVSRIRSTGRRHAATDPATIPLGGGDIYKIYCRSVAKCARSAIIQPSPLLR